MSICYINNILKGSFENGRIQSKAVRGVWRRIYPQFQQFKVLLRMCGKSIPDAGRRAGKTVSGSVGGGQAESEMRNYKVKSCALCGKDFKPKSGTSKYCSRCHTKMQKAWARRSAANAKWKRYLERELPVLDFLDAQHSPDTLI